MLALLTASEDELSTTLLVLPFALSSFQDFYEFSLNIEDVVLPQLEGGIRLSNDDCDPEIQVHLPIFYDTTFYIWGCHWYVTVDMFVPIARVFSQRISVGRYRL